MLLSSVLNRFHVYAADLRLPGSCEGLPIENCATMEISSPEHVDLPISFINLCFLWIILRSMLKEQWISEWRCLSATRRRLSVRFISLHCVRRQLFGCDYSRTWKFMYTLIYGHAHKITYTTNTAATLCSSWKWLSRYGTRREGWIYSVLFVATSGKAWFILNYI